MSNFLNPGQLVFGSTKAWFCGNDGNTYELTSQSGGSWFPSYGKNFTYTGEYVIVPEGDSGDWKVKFLTSGTFTATDALLIDVFAVGGGGGGGAPFKGPTYYYGGGGGGGGYTTTQKSVYLEKDKSYEIVIGDGGAAGNNGGNSTGFNITGNGGNAPIYADGYHINGGNGGSGGGAGSSDIYSTSSTTATVGASDGNTASNSHNLITGGTGQGSTTREFGEESGDLYAGGGGGGAGRQYSGIGDNPGKVGGDGGGGTGAEYNYASTVGTVNLGGGGGGGSYVSSNNRPGAAGGSGIKS